MAGEDRGHPVGTNKQGVKSLTGPGTAHAGRTHRHTGDRQPARHRLLCQQPRDVRGRHVALDEVVAYGRRVASSKVRCDLQPAFERIKRILIDILRLDREARLPDMIDPGGTAPAGGGFQDFNDGFRVGQCSQGECGSRSGQQKCASFHHVFLFELPETLELCFRESRGCSCLSA